MQHVELIETVTYCGENGRPEISGYGEDIEITHNEDGTIMFGGYLILPEQLQSIINSHNSFMAACATFNNETGEE